MKNHSREEQEQAMALVSQLFVIFKKLNEAKFKMYGTSSEIIVMI